MPITESDIKLLASTRMADTPDGGGRMTGTVVQDGVDNNIFDDVSNLDRVYGRVSLRKVFAAVLTEDKDKYLGVRAIVDDAPDDPNVHSLIFAASSTFDTRLQTSVKVESYLAPGPIYQGLLFGNHLAGQSTVVLIQRVERADPGIGDVVLLRKNEGLTNELDQYVRITAAASVVSTFTDSQGDFQRKVVTLSISDALRESFPGFDAIRADASISYVGKTKTYETVVADASNYFGIRPLEVAAGLGDFSIKADTVFSPLLPSAQIESPIADARSNQLSAGLVSAGGAVTLSVTLVFSTTQNLFIGGAVLPGSLTLTRGSVVITDLGGKLQVAGSDVGTIDYENGILKLLTDVFGTSGGTHAIVYTPAAAPQAVTQSLGIPVTLATRSLSYVLTLQPAPARASLSISYRSGGKWYVLREDGTGGITGADTSLGAGTYNYTTGTITVTLGALPDVGGSIIVQWVEQALSVAQPVAQLTNGGKVFFPLNTSGALSEAPGSKTIKPGALTITWNNGGTKTATDDGNGAITGDATGTVNYSSGVVLLSPTTLPAVGTVFNMNVETRTKTATSAPLTRTGPNVVGNLGANVAPGSVRFDAPVNGLIVPPSGYAYGSATASSFAGTVNLTVIDNGAGSLTTLNGFVLGTINYTTGDVSIPAVIAGMPPHYMFGVGTVPVLKYREGGISGSGYSYAATWTSVGYLDAPVSGTPGPASSTFEMLPPASVSASAGTVTTDTTSVTGDHAYINARVNPNFLLRGVAFNLGANRFVGLSSGNLARNPDPTTGIGLQVGTVGDATGIITLDDWATDNTSVVSQWSATQAPPTAGLSAPYMSNAITFRSAAAPLRVSSLSVLGTMEDGTTFNVTANSAGKIDGARIKGQVNYETGVIELFGVNPASVNSQTLDLTALGIAGVGIVKPDLIRTPTVRYNAVAYSYLPLDASILGLDPVRLPQDGRVPIFKAGRVVVIHNTQALAPQTVTGAQTVDTGRVRLARIEVIGADGNAITTGWTPNLDAGTVTFSDVTGYSQPVTIKHRIEDEALCAEAQITGDLRLTRALTHAFPVPGSFVSSAMVVGDLQADATDSFSQQTWTSVWQDTRIGSTITAQYNQTLNPIVVTNKGAIAERWALIFTSSTNFRVVGEASGEILQSNTGEQCQPINPATGVPYFSIAASGWGAGWAVGNVLRFNTRAANFPVWVARTVLQSPAAPPGTDQMTLAIRGDIDV